MDNETIVLESMIGRRTASAIPATVVDLGRPDHLSCFVPNGVSTLGLIREDGERLPRVLPPDAIERPEFQLLSRVWSGSQVLYLAPVDGRYAIHVRWSVDGTFAGWYVNLQSPTIRKPDRWVIEDQFLDIVVQPDRQWAWKDEDELAEAVAVGRLTRDEAADIRATGEAVVSQIDAGLWPFNPALASWRPDPRWPLPKIPATWEPTRR